MSTSTFPNDRAAYCEAVAQIAEKAKATLPEAVNGRLEAAVKLVLAGDVATLPDGSVTVGSSDPTRYYHLVGHDCTCTDFTQGKSPGGWCKHRIARAIFLRTQAQLPDRTAAAGPEPLPEAAASVNVRVLLLGHDIQLTLRGNDEGEVLERLQALLARPDIRPIPRPAPRSGGWQKRR
jgi:hypothetical protein